MTIEIQLWAFVIIAVLASISTMALVLLLGIFLVTVIWSLKERIEQRNEDDLEGERK